MSTLQRIDSAELTGFLKTGSQGGWDSFLQPESILSSAGARKTPLCRA
jgi:hypothetical protein